MDRLLLIAMELNDYETKRRNLYEAVDEKIYFNKYKLKYLPKSKIVVDGDEAIKALFKDRYY